MKILGIIFYKIQIFSGLSIIYRVYSYLILLNIPIYFFLSDIPFFLFYLNLYFFINLCIIIGLFAFLCFFKISWFFEKYNRYLQKFQILFFFFTFLSILIFISLYKHTFFDLTYFIRLSYLKYDRFCNGFNNFFFLNNLGSTLESSQHVLSMGSFSFIDEGKDGLKEYMRYQIYIKQRYLRQADIIVHLIQIYNAADFFLELLRTKAGYDVFETMIASDNYDPELARLELVVKMANELYSYQRYLDEEYYDAFLIDMKTNYIEREKSERMSLIQYYIFSIYNK